MLLRPIIAIVSFTTLLSCTVAPTTDRDNGEIVIKQSNPLPYAQKQNNSAFTQEKAPEIRKVSTPLFTNKDLPNNGRFSSSEDNAQNTQYTNSVNNDNTYVAPTYDFSQETNQRFLNWLDSDFSGYRKQEANDYYQFLKKNAGYVPPLENMLRSARSWSKCGFKPYGVPPRDKWFEMVGTVKLIKVLVDGGYIPAQYELVSVYRDARLNRCSGGSKRSKHIQNAAVDLRIDYMHVGERRAIERGICQFWYDFGEMYNFGLGIYKSGSIHIDTKGYRTWGSNYRASSSTCIKNKYKFRS